jgi:hypothetical protein
MMEERTARSAEPDDDGVEAPRSFPVPRNRPVFSPAEEMEEECEPHEGSWRGRALLISFLVVLGVTVVFAWRTLVREDPAPPAPAPEVRVPSTDPAVEIYFTPSQPESFPPVEENSTPLPVAPVSLDALFGREMP